MVGFSFWQVISHPPLKQTSKQLNGYLRMISFVSHVGHNSLYESAYHGVPVVAFPLGGDQDSNAKKAEHFGLGLIVYHKNCSPRQLFETIE